MLTSSARETLRGVGTVIVDEIHALAGTKRGAHLALSLERLEALADEPPQRIGLSATQRPLETIARFLGGHADGGAPRPVTIVDAGHRKPMELEVVVPVEDMASLGQPLDEPASGPRRGGPVAHVDLAVDPPAAARTDPRAPLDDRVRERPPARRAARGPAERARRGGPRAHAPRLDRARAAARGRGRPEVGAAARDRGHEQPRARHRHGGGRPRRAGRVAGLGRERPAAHRPRRPPGGRAEPRQDLPEVPRRPARGERRGRAHARRRDRGDARARATRSTCSRSRSSRCARSTSGASTISRRGAAGGQLLRLSRDIFLAVLDLLAGRYPSDGFAELRPRLVWDRQTDVVRHATAPAPRDHERRHDPRPRAVRRVPARRPRVGELDEEMVYESRAGEMFVLGASTWRIDDITRDRVVVTPAPGEPGKMPFWHGDKPGPPDRARAGDRGVHARAPRLAPREALARLATRSGSTRGPPTTSSPTSTSRSRPPAPCRRPHDRRRALPRRDRRLARLRPVAVRHPGARTVGAGDRGAARGRFGPAPRCCGATTAS